MSPGSIRLPSGIPLSHCAISASESKVGSAISLSSAGVRVCAGLIALTRIPCRPHSAASSRVSASTAPFDEV